MTRAQTTERSESGQLLPVARLRAWLARAKPGERLEYYRGLLALDRVKGTSSLTEAERRKLTAVADRVSALAGRGKLHLLQQRHGDADYSYWAVARAPIGSVIPRMPLPATAAQDRFAITDIADAQAGAPHHRELSMAAHLLEREEMAP
jgi:hypothetical protein